MGHGVNTGQPQPPLALAVDVVAQETVDPVDVLHFCSVKRSGKYP